MMWENEHIKINHGFLSYLSLWKTEDGEIERYIVEHVTFNGRKRKYSGTRLGCHQKGGWGVNPERMIQVTGNQK